MATTRSQDFTLSPSSVKLKQGFQYLVNHLLTILLAPVMAGIIIKAVRLGPDEIFGLWRSLELGPVHILSSAFLITFLSTVYFLSRPRPIYLFDYALYKPPTFCRIPFAAFMEHAKLVIPNHPESVEFMVKLLERSGLGEETYLPPASHYIPPRPTMEAAREEADKSCSLPLLLSSRRRASSRKTSTSS